MCDTMGTIRPGRALFAKNSDRSPNEPQVLEWYPAADHEEKTVKTTYIEVEQAAHTYSFLLSRPVWLWGGEMGVNEHGVCIGNEAVFTKGKYSKDGLTGMDMLRLALERARSAAEAIDVLTELLERYGQGGNCGYDHEFYYDNSFLVMDLTSLYILETAGREWVYKQMETGSISNRLSIGTDGDRYSGGSVIDFKKRHFEPLYSHFSGSAKRVACTGGMMAEQPDVPGLFNILRQHTHSENPLCTANVASPCMHAGGMVGDHSTASMVVDMDENRILIWATGSSTPCISLFKPYLFGNPVQAPVFEKGDRAALDYWLNREEFHRAAVGRVLPQSFYDEQSSLERSWFSAAEGAGAKEMEELAAQAARQESEFYANWTNHLPEERNGKRRFLKYWGKKTILLSQAQI